MNFSSWEKLETPSMLCFETPFLLVFGTLAMEDAMPDGSSFPCEKPLFPPLGQQSKYKNRSLRIGLFAMICLMANHSVLGY